jgi:hypothetical protein
LESRRKSNRILPLKKGKKVYPITCGEGKEGGVEVWLCPFFDIDARWGGYFPIRTMLKETSHVPFCMDLRSLWLVGIPREVI